MSFTDREALEAVVRILLGSAADGYPERKVLKAWIGALDDELAHKDAESADVALRACPFCGGTDVELYDASDTHWVQCETCHADGPLALLGCRDEDEEGSVDLEAEARAAWNRREPNDDSAAADERERCIAIIRTGCGFEIAQHLEGLIRGPGKRALFERAVESQMRATMLMAFQSFLNGYRGETVIMRDTLTSAEQAGFTRDMNEIRMRWVREALRDRDVAVLRWAAQVGFNIAGDTRDWVNEIATGKLQIP